MREYNVVLSKFSVYDENLWGSSIPYFLEHSRKSLVLDDFIELNLHNKLCFPKSVLFYLLLRLI